MDSLDASVLAISNSLNRLTERCKHNKLRFPTEQRWHVSPLVINASPIENVDHFKILGIHFDSELICKFYINAAACKLSSAIGIISSVKIAVF